MVELTINNIKVNVDEKSTILDAANKVGIYIPTLCYMSKDRYFENCAGACRICMVEVEGRRTLVPACATEVTPGMVVRTDTQRAIKTRRTMVELLLSNHPKDCLTCARNLNCELQTVAAQMGMSEVKFQGKRKRVEKDESSYSMVRNMEKCILCRRCEKMCNDIQTVGVYSTTHRGFDTVMSTALDRPISETSCTFCGQCVAVCPTGALTEKNEVHKIWAALNDPDKYVIVQTAPAIRVALGEMFGFSAGTIVTGKMVSALRRLGFDKVLDTDFAADMTIMEEATEFAQRLKSGENLPILTSCCPAWVNFIEHNFPNLLNIPSSAKSPHEMFGAIAKTYYAEKIGVDPAKIVVVSIMPCIAKKYEAHRDELKTNNLRDVDYVLSTRELGKMIQEAGILFEKLDDGDFDNLMGESSGASVIFGTTGGVIEAATRTAYAWLDNTGTPKIDFTELRGFEGVREASVMINGKEIKIAIAHGLGNARRLLDAVSNGTAHYHAIEIMACPGGCVGGGGQPYHNIDIIKTRQKAIYQEDVNKPVRQSHENAEIKKLYAEFLGEPCGHKAHELLHTKYFKKENL